MRALAGRRRQFPIKAGLGARCTFLKGPDGAGQSSTGYRLGPELGQTLFLERVAEEVIDNSFPPVLIDSCRLPLLVS